MMWKPNGVSTMSEISPTFSLKTATSNAPTICPRPKRPSEPHVLIEERVVFAHGEHVVIAAHLA